MFTANKPEVTYKVQTCNDGNPEVIKLENGIAKEIVAGDTFPVNIIQARAIAHLLNENAKRLTEEA
jgi:hypothetical protein